ncbi:gastrula zinc finger protein XlCGF46.1-like isoform X2 [Linepithema humile]|uniref:gastrula zinc finger protein XlCGF46.1-like isoform X2 n=1 Tax=Linepithema humile TaxID=83485 RepID=UPI00351E2A59
MGHFSIRLRESPIIPHARARNQKLLIKIKTEILDEIENFSVNDELDIEQHVKSKQLERVLCHENSEQIPKSDCQRNASVSLSRRQMDEYTDLKEYIVSLTRGKLLMCNVCKIEFPNEAEFRTHMIGHSYGKLFQCGFCKKQFSRSATYKDHMHFTPKPFACRQCELQFQKKRASEERQAKAHSRRKTFRCFICKKEFLHHRSLRDHKLMHNNAKPHGCTTCGKSFLRPSSLRTHMIVHTADLPFACNLCPAKFKRSSVLKTHKLTHTSVRRFECDICKHRFHLKGALKHHILAHYGIKPYKCEDCGQTYRRSWGLKVHRYRHTGVKQFECDFCKLRFSVKTKLANHIYTHTGEKPYKCNACGRQYGERYQLKAHRCTALLDNSLKLKTTQISFYQPKLSKSLIKVNSFNSVC